MVSLKDICDNIATLYRNVAVPSGAAALRKSAGQAPHGIPALPLVVVLPQTGDVIAESGSWVITHHIDVQYYISKSPGDLPRQETQRQLWLPSLLAAPLSQMTLGIANVKSTLPMGYEFRELPYGGQGYDGIIVHLDVIVREPVTFTP